MFRYLDTYTSFFFIASGIGLFLGLALLIDKAEERRKQLPLILILFGFSLTLFEYVHIWSEQAFIPRLRGIWLSMPYLFGPCLYLYVHRLRGDQPKHLWLSFLPLALALTIHAYIWFVPADMRAAFVSGHYEGAPWLMTMLRHIRQYYVWLPYMGVYAALAGRYAWSFSNFRYGRLVVMLFTGYWVALLSYYVLVAFPFFNVYYDYSISFMMTAFIYSIGLIMMKKPEWMAHSLQKAREKYKGEEIPSTLLQSILPQLDRLMEEEQRYVDADLRIQTVADELGISTHLLSQLLNSHYGESFTQFVNRYRIAHAQALMQGDPSLTVKEVAYQSGYNNPTSFYNNFKAIAGMAPSEYLKTAVV